MSQQRILIGDCREHLASLLERSVHCIVTSPPYWGLRDYGIPASTWQDGWQGCYGNETTIEQYIGHTLEIFEHLGRVLRDDGVIWWNIGDTYSSGARKGKNVRQTLSPSVKSAKNIVERVNGKLAQGNKCLVAYRVAIALQEAGWVIRQDIQWVKPSPMPESIGSVRWERCRVKTANGLAPKWSRPDEVETKPVRESPMHDKYLATYEPCPGCAKCESNGGYILSRGAWRPTLAHEQIFMITKSNTYVCHADQVSEPASGKPSGNTPNSKYTQAYYQGDTLHGKKQGLPDYEAVATRNPRSTWRIAPESYRGPHFAPFPSEIPYRCIKAATSDQGCCPHCGAQWAAVISRDQQPTRPGSDSKVNRASQYSDSPYDEHTGMIVGNRDPQRHCTTIGVDGYRPTCSCPAHEPIPCTVLDPFVGSGTTLQVCACTNRQGIGIDIGEKHRDLIEQRIATKPACLIRREPKTPKTRQKNHSHVRLLFDS